MPCPSKGGTWTSSIGITWEMQGLCPTPWLIGVLHVQV